MNKAEAKQALSEGKKLHHRFFGNDEWVMEDKTHLMHKTVYVFEDGVVQDPAEFWSLRFNDDWDKDWEIVPE